MFLTTHGMKPLNVHKNMVLVELKRFYDLIGYFYSETKIISQKLVNKLPKWRLHTNRNKNAKNGICAKSVYDKIFKIGFHKSQVKLSFLLG